MTKILIWVPGADVTTMDLSDLLSVRQDSATATMGEPETFPGILIPGLTAFSIPSELSMVPGTAQRVAEGVLSLTDSWGPHTVHLMASRGTHLSFVIRPVTLPESPLTELEQMAAEMHEAFTAFTGAGFTQEQALFILVHGTHYE